MLGTFGGVWRDMSCLSVGRVGTFGGVRERREGMGGVRGYVVSACRACCLSTKGENGMDGWVVD